MSADGKVDGIILGTGHNALVLQAYLCRLGLKVISIDRANRCGGGLSTIENPRVPGAFHNPHSFYHRAITAMPWYRDLELDRHGARYIEPQFNVAMLLRDGRSLQWWTDNERTADSFEQFSKKDAAALRRWVEEFRPILDEILTPEARSAPLPPEERSVRLRSSALGRRLLEVQALSPLEFVTREFEHDVIRAGLLFFNGLREVDLRLHGFGHAIPALLASRHKAQMCCGGSAGLAEALAADIREHGGGIILNAQVTRIVVEKGRTRGIELASGERIEANAFVASGLNPHQTFLEYLLPEDLPPEIREKAEAFEYNLLAPLFAVHTVLNEPIEYNGLDGSGEPPFMVILGLESMSQFHDIVSAHESGSVAAPVTWGSSPTLFDRTQAPEGLHTAFMWEKVPYALNGNAGNWERMAESHGLRLIEHWGRYAPRMRRSVVDHFFLTPLDTERTLPNMRRGDLLVGSFARGQVGYNRPFAGAGQYRTPLEGLYLCGGSTHPGGNITGLCGYNAARVIASDLGDGE